MFQDKEKAILGADDGVAGEFGSVLANPGLMTVFMLLCVVFCFSICAMGLQNGVEKITKDDDGLPVIPDGCAGNQFGGWKADVRGLEFYLKPDFGKDSGGWCRQRSYLRRWDSRSSR